mmetsp:Transcript_7381/g.10462  ORF Transcript_7381/g.10462 Transcript_7381/m.10462 type:complete len:142 (+) Transcript_7381:110-535(+)
MSWISYLDNYLTNCKYTGRNISGTNKYAAIISNKNGIVWAQSSSCPKISFEEVDKIFENPNVSEIALMGKKFFNLKKAKKGAVEYDDCFVATNDKEGVCFGKSKQTYLIGIFDIKPVPDEKQLLAIEGIIDLTSSLSKMRM